MSVDVEEHVFVRGWSGVALVPVGAAVDQALDGGEANDHGGVRRLAVAGEVLCFGVDDHAVRLRPAEEDK